MVETSFSNVIKNSVHHSVLIDQVHKFQNGYFKEHLWKLLLFYKKHIA